MPVLVQVYDEVVHDIHGNPKGIIGELYQDGEVQFKINTVDTGVRGTDLFLRMMAAFGTGSCRPSGNGRPGQTKTW